MSKPRMRFDSRMDVALAIWTITFGLFCLLIMAAAISVENYGLAAFDFMLALCNGAVLASVTSRRRYR